MPTGARSGVIGEIRGDMAQSRRWCGCCRAMCPDRGSSLNERHTGHFFLQLKAQSNLTYADHHRTVHWFYTLAVIRYPVRMSRNPQPEHRGKAGTQAY
jgi:hypothetical protein